MKRIAYILGLAVVISACSSSSNESAANNADGAQQEEQVAVIPDRILTMEIDGMVCKMGCGGSIRKELKATGGVSNVEFDFEEDRATNVATISFDKDIVTVDEMIKAVSALNDGQFTIGETSSESYDAPTTNETNSTSSSEKTVEVSSGHVEMPNFLDLLSGFLIK